MYNKTYLLRSLTNKIKSLAQCPTPLFIPPTVLLLAVLTVLCPTNVPNPGSKGRRKSMPMCVPEVTTKVCHPPQAT
jgi:hypothetical protein